MSIGDGHWIHALGKIFCVCRFTHCPNLIPNKASLVNSILWQMQCFSIWSFSFSSCKDKMEKVPAMVLKSTTVAPISRSKSVQFRIWAPSRDVRLETLLSDSWLLQTSCSFRTKEAFSVEADFLCISELPRRRMNSFTGLAEPLTTH